MAKQVIDLGTAGDLATGDNARAAFEKVNENFSEVYVDIANLKIDDANDVTKVNNRTGSVELDITDAKYSIHVLTGSAEAIPGGVHVLTANLNLTLPSTPELADSIKISNLSQVDTCQVIGNGEKILGLSSDLTLDNRYSSFEMVYTGTAKGWVIIGQN